jgi:hypothetical protein
MTTTRGIGRRGIGTQGIEGLYIETHNWGKTVAFWQAMGYVLEFETDHGSGQLTHPAGGPYVFVAERPAAKSLETHPIVRAEDASTFTPPAGAAIDKPFTPEHWGVVEMYVVDPDGRHVSVQAPIPEGVATPPGHH